jgi:hypothetical protein
MRCISAISAGLTTHFISQACFADESKKVARFLAFLIFISYLCT